MVSFGSRCRIGFCFPLFYLDRFVKRGCARAGRVVRAYLSLVYGGTFWVGAWPWWASLWSVPDRTFCSRFEGVVLLVLLLRNGLAGAIFISPPPIWWVVAEVGVGLSFIKVTNTGSVWYLGV